MSSTVNTNLNVIPFSFPNLMNVIKDNKYILLQEKMIDAGWEPVELDNNVIVFKHNEDYSEQILDMCYNELDMTDHLVQPSNRFNRQGREEYIDENGIPFILEESSLPLDDPRFKLPAPHRDHTWWEEKGNAMVYNKDTSNEKPHTERNI